MGTDLLHLYFIVKGFGTLATVRGQDHQRALRAELHSLALPSYFSRQVVIQYLLGDSRVGPVQVGGSFPRYPITGKGLVQDGP